MDKSFHRSDIGQKGIRRLEQLAQEEKVSNRGPVPPKEHLWLKSSS